MNGGGGGVGPSAGRDVRRGVVTSLAAGVLTMVAMGTASGQVVPIEAAAGSCGHLESIDVPPPAQTAGCTACAAEGTDPVQLRLCLVCGHVGCCDDTPGQHARQHHLETGHPTIATVERGADWAYCYLHDVSVPGFMARG